MDVKNRRLLQQHQSAIIRDLDVTYILDKLLTENAVSLLDYERINNLNDREERTRYLLQLLFNGPNSAYEAFVDSLMKDYNWLWEKLAKKDITTVMENSFEDGLSKGDVPRWLEHFVRRLALESEVVEKLKVLSRHKVLALHGMSGCGKTIVAISALRNYPDVVTTNFNGVVFWLNLKTCKTEDDIFAQQNKLYRKASTMYTNNSHLTSSISISISSIASAPDSFSSYDLTSEDIKDRLKLLFEEQSLKESLLVLDEVNENKILAAFDIGCKILVTTRDTDVLANFHPQIIKIEDHFTEKESLNLFAACIGVEANRLPPQAKKLHEICKGSTFQIGLIGAELAENKERLINDKRLWNDYIYKLRKPDYLFSLRTRDVDPMKTIEFCINSLKPEILPLFKMLAVLPDNAKISVKVLSKLWNKDILKVERIVKQLYSKSLIRESYDEEQKNYTYEIHQLIMRYLRSSCNAEELKTLHLEFLKSYNYVDVNNYSIEIQDDGYIAFYIGYHLFNTENLDNSYQLFNKLFLDMKFLGNKVRLTGPADVILDLQIYEGLIAKDDNLDQDTLAAIRAYLSTYGNDLQRYPCTDIVQSILQNEHHGLLYTKAYKVAQKECAENRLYFQFLHEQDVEDIKYSTIDVQDVITSVCFLGDYITVGTNHGVLKIFHISTNKLKKELPSTKSSIKWIGECPVNPQFVAALTADGTIHLWYIDDIDIDEHALIEEENRDSHNSYPINRTIPPKLGPYLNCRWANNQETLFTHTKDMIVLYNTLGEVLTLIDKLYRDRDILCCVPCNYDKNVIVATNSGDKCLEVVNIKTSARQTFEESERVLDIVTVPGSNRILTLKKTEVTEHEFVTLINRMSHNCRGRTVIIKSDAVKDKVSFISMAVNKTGTILFVSTDDSRIICMDLNTLSYMFDLENKRGNVVSMAVSEVLWDNFEPGIDVLLTGTGSIEENSAKVWYLEASYISQNLHKSGKVRLTAKFDASFINPVSPSTPNSYPPSSGSYSTTSPPRRHQSFNQNEISKKNLKVSRSLDRHSLKPLNLKGICNGTGDGTTPLLAVVDDRSNIQIMKGRKLVTEVFTNSNEQITAIKISPCNQYILYGLQSGVVKKYTIRSKETNNIIDVCSKVKYLDFVNPDLLMVAGKNRRLMAYRRASDNTWRPELLQRGNGHFGSQDFLNDRVSYLKPTKQLEEVVSSSSESSSLLDSYSNGESKELSKETSLVHCYWVPETGLVTVESNATVKLWDQGLKLASVLNVCQADVYVSCTAFQKNVLVLCDDCNVCFQIFTLTKQDHIELRLTREVRLNNRITSCSLTADGNILALGLESGDVVVWNVPNKCQLQLLKHHKSSVQWCSFSPVPDRLARASPAPSGSASAGAAPLPADDQPPLVLVTMASEIVWWNITHVIRTRANIGHWRSGRNAVTPIASPLELRPEARTSAAPSQTPFQFFFGDYVSPHHCWRANWKRKTCKEGSKKKEILSCIKLSGVNAKQICYDDKFSCFVTVDNAGHINIMNVMHANTT